MSEKNEQSITDTASLHESIGKMAAKIEHLEEGQKEIKAMLEKGYVTQEEFKPIKAIVYGMVAAVCLSVLGALIALVIKTAAH